MRSLEAIYKKPGFWAVDPGRTETAPFPGRYPTRWRIIFHGKKTDYQVITKPNPLLINSIMRVAKHMKGIFDIQEFDQLGAFRSTRVNTPRKIISPQTTNYVIFVKYYPWHPGSQDIFFDAWMKPVYEKLIKLGKRKFFVYSPYAVMWNEEGFQRLRDYRQWLRKQN